VDNVELYLDRLRVAAAALPRDNLTELGDMLYRAYLNGKQVFTLGNGGSASTASHMAADIAKNTIGPHMARFRVLSLSDNSSIITALANDLGYENIFSEQLQNLIHPGDVLIAVSASGNSPNVIKAIQYAQSECASVAALLGFDGGRAAEMADVAIVVPSDHYGVIEDVHLVVNHIIVDFFKAKLAEEQPWLVS
jgi:D-sedoheptulose 7-phosphate isomerase